MPRLGLAVTRMVAAEPALDPLDPGRFDRFFQELYFLQPSLDEKNRRPRVRGATLSP
jgi:hypothetical protein